MMYFIEIAKERGFSKAAAKLHLSQPALSKMIKQLEEELGFQLVYRASKNFMLTDYGEIFLKNARKIIEKHDDIFKEMNDISGLRKGRINIDFPSIVATLYFPRIFTGFRRKYPGIEICMFEEGSKIISERVLKGLVDIGVVMLPNTSEELTVFPLVNDESVLIVNKAHPLAEKDKITFKDLYREEFIILNENFKLHDLIIKECMKVGYVPNIIFKSSQFDFIMEMISLNQGISILPRPMLERYDYPMIRRISFEPGFPWNIGMIVKKGSYMSIALRTFIDYVQNIHKGLS